MAKKNSPLIRRLLCKTTNRMKYSVSDAFVTLYWSWWRLNNSRPAGRCPSPVYYNLRQYSRLKHNSNNSVNSRTLTPFTDLRCWFLSWRRVCRYRAEPKNLKLRLCAYYSYCWFDHKHRVSITCCKRHIYFHFQNVMKIASLNLAHNTTIDNGT